MTSSDNLSKTNSAVNRLLYWLIATAVLGFGDAVYLTTSYYTGDISCSAIVGCAEVLHSSYSAIFGIPTALLGSLFYLTIILLSFLYLQNKTKLALRGLIILPSLAFMFTLWLVYLQLFIIEAICIYCMISAASSTLLFILSLVLMRQKDIANNKPLEIDIDRNRPS